MSQINLLNLHVHKLRKATLGGAHTASVRPLRFVCSAVFNYMIIYHLIHRILPQSAHRVELPWG